LPKDFCFSVKVPAKLTNQINNNDIKDKLCDLKLDEKNKKVDESIELVINFFKNDV
jgi:hypothetical protein